MLQAQRLAVRAINERGVALYNSGDVAGCARVYANTIADILGGNGGGGSVRGGEEVVSAEARAGLCRGLEEAGRAVDPDAQAWVLRGALDRFVAYRERAGGAAEGAGDSVVPKER